MASPCLVVEEEEAGAYCGPDSEGRTLQAVQAQDGHLEHPGMIGPSRGNHYDLDSYSVVSHLLRLGVEKETCCRTARIWSAHSETRCSACVCENRDCGCDLCSLIDLIGSSCRSRFSHVASSSHRMIETTRSTCPLPAHQPHRGMISDPFRPSRTPLLLPQV